MHGHRKETLRVERSAYIGREQGNVLTGNRGLRRSKHTSSVEWHGDPAESLSGGLASQG